MGDLTYPNNNTTLYQSRQLATPGATPPELPRCVVRGDIDCLERQLVGLQNGFETSGGGDDMG